MNPTIETLAVPRQVVSEPAPAAATRSSLLSALSRTRARLAEALQSRLNTSVEDVSNLPAIQWPDRASTGHAELFEGPSEAKRPAHRPVLSLWQTLTKVMQNVTDELTSPLLSPIPHAKVKINPIDRIITGPAFGSKITSLAPASAASPHTPDGSMLVEAGGDGVFDVAFVEHDDTEATCRIFATNGSSRRSAALVTLHARAFNSSRLKLLDLRRIAGNETDDSIAVLLQLQKVMDGPIETVIAYVSPPKHTSTSALDSAAAGDPKIDDLHIDVRSLPRELRPGRHLELSQQRGAIGVFGGDPGHLRFSLFDIEGDASFAVSGGF